MSFYSTNEVNSTSIVVDNQTPFTLVPEQETYTYRDGLASGPRTVKPYQTDGHGGIFVSSKHLGTEDLGSIGMVGYQIKVQNPSDPTNPNQYHIRLLSNNPTKNNTPGLNLAWVTFTTGRLDINQAEYDKVYEKRETTQHRTASLVIGGKSLVIRASIGTNHHSAALFYLTYE